MKKTWKNMKDNFSKCFKKRERMTRSGAPAATLPKYRLFDQLLFIRDTVANRPTVSNINLQSEDGENLFTSPQSPLCPPAGACSSFNSDKPQKPQLPLKRRLNSADSVDKKHESIDPVDKALLKVLDNTPKIQGLEDPDVAFAHSIVPILRALPPKKNRMAKVDIQKLLIGYEFDSE